MESSASPLAMFFAVVGGLSVMGFVVGTSAEDYDLDPLETARSHAEHHPSEPADDVPQARSYRELRQEVRPTPSGWTTDLAALRADPQPATRASASALRAYDGAPPQIPHPVRQDSAPECLACHDEELRLRGRLAPEMSHDHLTSCTQCHVVRDQPMPGAEPARPWPRLRTR